MPWCPKCETEYREGITVCADCGSDLVDDLSAKYPQTPTMEETQIVESMEEIFQDMSEEEASAFLEETKKEALERRKRLAEGPGIYVESSKKAQDFKSGGFSLLFVGGIGLIFVLLVLFNVIPLHMNLFSKYLIIGVMGSLFILFIVMGFLSVKSYKKFEIKATEEDNLTANISAWCKEHLTSDIIDAELEEEEEELKYFRRTEKMKEMISDKFMNLDAAFLDSFVDDLYQNIFE